MSVTPVEALIRLKTQTCQRAFLQLASSLPARRWALPNWVERRNRFLPEAPRKKIERVG
jgi:hypothetical protein